MTRPGRDQRGDWAIGARVIVQASSFENEASNAYAGQHGTVESGKFPPLVRIDGVPDPVKVMPGLLRREIPSDEAALTVRNLLAAGYRMTRRSEYGPGPGRWMWWKDTGNGSGNGYGLGPNQPTAEDPYPISDRAADAYGHDLPPCIECGQPVSRSTPSGTAGLCFTCGFWLEKLTWPKGETLRVEHGDQVRHYHPRTKGIRSGPKDGLGFGGAVVTVHFLDGRPSLTTNDLFEQGIVPARFYDRLPVNATLEWRRP